MSENDSTTAVECLTVRASVAGSRPVLAVLLIIVAYLLGTFPSAILIARANGIDIATVGSGNPGASNVTRALGWRKGIWVYVLDALKAAIATGLALGLDGRPLAYWCACVAVIGHMFPVFREFKGGKGVASGSGAIVVMHPLVGVLAPFVWWLVTRLTHKAAFGSIFTVALVPVGMTVLGRPAWEFFATAALCSLILVKHWRNFGRLIRREEPSLSKN
jgi:acyl phosphate:glycerol-3-phosphate acyltransferase